MSWAEKLKQQNVNGAAPKALATESKPADTKAVKLPAGIEIPKTTDTIQFGTFTVEPKDAPEEQQLTVKQQPKPPQAKPATFAAAAKGTVGRQQPPPQQQYGGPRPPRNAPNAQVANQMYAGYAPYMMAQPGMAYPGQQYSMMMPGTGYYPGGYPTQAYQYMPSPQGGVMGPHGQGQGQAGNGGGASYQAPPPTPQQSAAKPATIPAGSAPKASPAAVPLPTRERKILRIENPDTHEVLDLSSMPGQKKKEEEEAAAAKKATELSKAGDEAKASAKTFKDMVLEPPKGVDEEGITPTVPKEESKAAESEDSSSGVEAAAAAAESESEPSRPSSTAPSSSMLSTPFSSIAGALSGVLLVDDEETQGEEEEEEEEEEGEEEEEEEEGVAVEEPIILPNGRKRYSNKFLFACQPQCKDPLQGMEPETFNILARPDEEKEWFPGRHHPSKGRSDRNGQGGEGGDKWKSGRAPPTPPGPPGMRSGRTNSRRPGAEADTWERGRPLPPMPGRTDSFRGGPPPGMSRSGGPLPALHRSQSAYRVGRIISQDPEEEKAQKALKSMLNKVTPQNFEKISAQIIEKINERKKAVTLQGLIDQIFDKALLETTFSELYANLVAKLNPALPELEDEEGRPVQFRRTLLNKCQEEFDYGVQAMNAVSQRELQKAAHHEKHEEEAKEEEMPKEVEETTEEGELPAASKATDKAREEAAQVQAEVKARKRMLGNIIFVGQLYRMGVLTEQIMHECIKQLIQEFDNPRPEDMECLCKLLTTVGRPMDLSTKIYKQYDERKEVVFTRPTREMMGFYFDRIQQLSVNDKLDQRHRFMLKDLVDLRDNKWSPRQSSEGPKKISEIHRDAVKEQIDRSRSAGVDRQGNRGDYRGGGARPPGPPSRPLLVDGPIRPMTRVGSRDLAAPSGQSFRPGGRPAPPPRDAKGAPRPAEPPRRTASGDDSGSARPSPSAVSSSTDLVALSSEEVTRKARGLLDSLFATKDLEEGLASMQELSDGAREKGSGAIVAFFDFMLNEKDVDWELFTSFLISASGVLSHDVTAQGVRETLNVLDDWTVDAPRAPLLIGPVLGSLVASGALELGQVSGDVLDAELEPEEGEEGRAEGEQTLFVSSGGAAKLMGALLKQLSAALGSEEAGKKWKDTGASLEDFVPAGDSASQLIDEFGLAVLVAL